MLNPMKAPHKKCALEKMDPVFVRQAADTLRLMAHPDRLRIINALNMAGALKVCEITEHLEIPQPATSQHLNQMRRAGLLTMERRGKEAWYSICNEDAIGLINFLCNCSKKSDGHKPV